MPFPAVSFLLCQKAQCLFGKRVGFFVVVAEGTVILEPWVGSIAPTPKSGCPLPGAGRFRIADLTSQTTAQRLRLSCNMSPLNILRVWLVLATIAQLTPARAQMPVPALPQVHVDTTYRAPTGGKTWQAHSGAELKTTIEAARPGDVIVLDAKVTYEDNFVLPVKSNPEHKWIYLVSSELARLPEPGTRVAPADAVNMPKIVTPNVNPPITVPPGASYYRLVGLEITSASTQGCKPPANCFSYQLVYVGGLPGQPLPDSITVDRCYLHGSPTLDVREGVIANGSSIAVIDSYISDIHQNVFDSQAVLAYFSPGPIKIVNNFLSATTENIMFGGAGAKMNNPWVPSDIEIRNNWLFKPLEWAAVGVTIPPHNQWVEKNSLEFKNARRVLVDGNTMENTWVSGQTGFAVLFTVRTGQSGNLAVVDDITITNNVLKNVTAGFSALYHDNSCGKPPYTECTSQGEARRILVDNNLILFRDPHLPGTPPNSNWGVLLNPDMTDFVFQHNTTVPAPGTDCYQSIFFNMYQNMKWPPPESVTHNVWILDNALCRQPSGGSGGQGTTGMTYYMGDPPPLAPRYVGNVMYVPGNSKMETFPPGNLSTKTPIKYTELNGKFLLTVPEGAKTSDGKTAGVDVNKLSTAGSGSAEGTPGGRMEDQKAATLNPTQ